MSLNPNNNPPEVYFDVLYDENDEIIEDEEEKDYIETEIWEEEDLNSTTEDIEETSLMFPPTQSYKIFHKLSPFPTTSSCQNSSDPTSSRSPIGCDRLPGSIYRSFRSWSESSSHHSSESDPGSSPHLPSDAISPIKPRHTPPKRDQHPEHNSEGFRHSTPERPREGSPQSLPDGAETKGTPLEEFEGIQERLSSSLHNVISEEIADIKSNLSKIEDLFDKLCIKHRSLGESCREVNFEDQSPLITGTPLQPPLKQLLDFAEDTITFGSEICAQIDTSVKVLTIKGLNADSQTENLKISFTWQLRVPEILAYTSFCAENQV